MIRDEIKNSVKGAVKDLYNIEADVKIDHPENKDYGDYSTNIAFQIAKELKKSPLEIGEEICKKITKYDSSCLAGFINLKVPKEYLQKQVGEILKEGQSFGELRIGRGQKVNVEFISANPTGPLTLGNGRGGFCGDVLTNILQKAGSEVIREYYINDRGEQIKKLGHSVLGDEEAVYKGKYIDDLKKRIKMTDVTRVGEEAAKIILEEMIKPSIKKMGIKFDVWFSEKKAYESKKVDQVISFLDNKGFTLRMDNVTFATTATQISSDDEKMIPGLPVNIDDKDRVLIKSTGEKTYFASDIAYLENKFKRGFDRLVFFWGADHYGYIERIKWAAQALGYKREQIDIIIMQLVKLFQGGKEVRMSKRTGIYVTMDELIDEVGLDTARFFFLSKAANTHLDFDMDLAKEQSDKNPVYYVQYAHARICSILGKAKNKKKGNLSLLSHKSETSLIKQLIRLPEIIEDVSRDYQVQRLPQYAVDLATSFHGFYRDCRVICEDKNLQGARLSLILATRTVIKNTLSLMGISAPEKM